MLLLLHNFFCIFKFQEHLNKGKSKVMSNLFFYARNSKNDILYYLLIQYFKLLYFKRNCHIKIKDLFLL